MDQQLLDTLDCDRIVALILHDELMEIRAMTLVRGGEKYRGTYTLNMELVDGCSMSMRIDRLLLYAVRGRKVSYVEPRLPRFSGVQFTRCAMMIITRCIDCTSTQNFRSVHYQAGSVVVSVGAYRTDRTKYMRHLRPEPVFVGPFANKFTPISMADLASQAVLGKPVSEVLGECQAEDNSSAGSCSPDGQASLAQTPMDSGALTNLDFLNDWVSSDSAPSYAAPEQLSAPRVAEHGTPSPDNHVHQNTSATPDTPAVQSESATAASMHCSTQPRTCGILDDELSEEQHNNSDSDTDTGSDSDSDWEEFDAGFVDLLRARKHRQQSDGSPSDTNVDDAEPDIVVHGLDDPGMMTSAGAVVVCDSPNGLQCISSLGQSIRVQEAEQEEGEADTMAYSSSSSSSSYINPVGTSNSMRAVPEDTTQRTSVHASSQDVGSTVQKITGKRKRWKLEIECDDQSGGIVDDVINMVKIICTSNLACDKDINMVNCVSNGQELLALWKFSQENLPASVDAADK